MINIEKNRTLSILGTMIAVSLAIIALFATCGLAELAGFGQQATHMWVSLFTAAPIASAQAWLEGLFFSVVFGIVSGAIFAVVHNAVAARGL